MAGPKKGKKPIAVEALKHKGAKRRNIPTAELEPVMEAGEKSPVRVAYERRNRDLDPQLVWRGKDEQDWSDLVVAAPPLYIQEKVHPKVLVDDLLRQSKARAQAEAPAAPDLFADFNGLPDKEAVTEFYRHDAHWSNRMILGDSLQVMASLAEREGLRGKVQCIYLDPPYGIRFNSNFQWSTTSRDVKDGARDHITREPEQVKAFRDTWRDGIHSYLTYLRDRLTVARDLLHESGSIFVQISDENIHHLREILDELFGRENFISMIFFRKTGGSTSEFLSTTVDSLLWYARDISIAKYKRLYNEKIAGNAGALEYKYVLLQNGARRSCTEAEMRGLEALPAGAKLYTNDSVVSDGTRANTSSPFRFGNFTFDIPKNKNWKTSIEGMKRLCTAGRIELRPGHRIYIRFLDDFPAIEMNSIWMDVRGALDRQYVVETSSRVIERCLLMTTDPGDIVLDPTCGSGTTAYVAEQWGRRWITIDTSRVALALARARVMGARYPWYLLADSPEGQRKEAEVTRTAPRTTPTRGDLRQGFVYERVPHITLKSIANNAEIDVIWEKRQPAVEAALARLNAALKGHTVPYTVTAGGRAGKAVDFRAAAGATVRLPSGEDAPAGALLEWEVPREAPDGWPKAAGEALAQFWEARIARQKEIDASIAAKAETEYLYDKPYVDNGRVRVAGPFTVESLSPHRVLAVDQDDELVDELDAAEGRRERPAAAPEETDFAQVVLDHLRTAGVQQAHKADRIAFTALAGWPGTYIGAEGRYLEGERERRAGIFIGPEFGTVARADLVAAAREAADAGFDVLIACAFNFDAHSSEFDKLGRIAVLKARINPELHMAGELKNTGGGNLFVVFGEPDIAIEPAGRDAAGQDQVQVRIKGVDVFHPQTGAIESGGPDTIAMWFIDTDYNEESFFVRHAYFLGANDPYKALKTTLRAEIDEMAWESLHSDTSRPFPKPGSGRIAVKVINHLGDEVMKVFGVG